MAMTITQEIIKECKNYLNEVALNNLNSARRQNKKSKNIKGLRKKTAGAKKMYAPATPYHCCDSLVTLLKFQIILFLKIDFNGQQFSEWCEGINLVDTITFRNSMRTATAKEVLRVLEDGELFFKPLDIKEWFFKSGFIKRSNNLIIYHHQKFPSLECDFRDEDVKKMKENYVTKVYEKYTDKEIINFLYGVDRKKEIVSSQDFEDYFKSLYILNEAIKINIEDCEDQGYRKKAKYLTTMIDTLIKKMREFAYFSSDIFLKRAKEKVFKEFTKELGDKKWMLEKSCKLEGVPFSDETISIWQPYLDYLNGLTDQELQHEKKWLQKVKIK